jgi:Fanconi anemia group M protein
MPPVCRIIADSREPAYGVPRALAERGVAVVVERLIHGDYALPNGVVIERKTVNGLHASITGGRFWDQVAELRRSCRAPYLLIEGPLVPRELPWSHTAIGVCLGVLGQGMPIIWSVDTTQTAEWLHRLAVRSAGAAPVRDRPAYARRRKAGAEHVPEAILAAVPGISVKRARALLQAFGTVRGVMEAGQQEWLGVRGIGPIQAARLDEAFS